MTATHAKKLVLTANGQSRALPASLIIHARSTPAQSYAIYINYIKFFVCNAHGYFCVVAL